MVGNNHVYSHRPDNFGFFFRRYTAVGSNNKVDVFFFHEIRNDYIVQSVTVGMAIWHVIGNVRYFFCKIRIQHCNGSKTVAVIVSVNQNSFIVSDGLRYSVRRFPHPAQRIRVDKVVGRRIDKLCDFFGGVDTSFGQQHGKGTSYTAFPCKRLRRVFVVFVS